MHAIVKTAALSLTVFALACGGKSTQSASTGGMDDGLRKDLQLAASPNLELASSARTQQKRMVVSDIERTPGAAPVRAATKSKTPPKPAAASRTPTVVEVTAPKPAPTPPPVVVAQATSEEPAPDPQPSAAPRPEPPAVIYPIPSTEGSRGRGGLGGIIGVVIRGGVMDGDHCDPRGTMGRRGGIAINSRLPSHGTFPIPR